MTSKRLVLFALISVVLESALGSIQNEEFHEEVLLRTLPTGDVLASFSFTTLSPVPTTGPRKHYDLLPRFVGELMDENGIQELDVALSRGVWRSRFWGYPPKPTATGARVSAFFKPDVVDLDKAWTKLVNGLSGQFCASLNFLDTTQSVTPKWSFQPRGITLKSSENSTNGHFRYGTLPGENVCTENLTPWKKLLPCESKRGLATLLNSHSIHRTRYHSIGLSIRMVCPGQAQHCTDPVVELNQNVVLVFDPAILYNNPHYPVKKYDWSVRNLFGMGVTSSCPLATASKIFVDVVDENKVGQLLPTDIAANLTTIGGRLVYVYDVPTMVSRGVSNIQFVHEKDPVYGILKPPVLHATRYLVGQGHEQGGIVSKVYNTDPKNPLNIVYLDVIPWFLRVYLHTLKVVDGSTRKLVQPLRLHFVPGVDRERPYSIEMVLRVPPKSHLEISIGFEYSLLKWLEYPPDANKGFYVGSAVISAMVPAKSQNLTSVFRQTSTYHETLTLTPEGADFYELVQLFTESLLVNLPTPDFSMPYNVICLTCTVVALAFGPLHNITTKSLEVIYPDPKSDKSTKQKIFDKISSFFSKKKKTETDQEEEDETQNKETEDEKVASHESKEAETKKTK